MKMIHVVLSVKPEKVERYEAEFQKLKELTLANEPGCPIFELARDPEVANRYHVFEAYASPEAIAEHVETPYYKTSARVFVECLAGDHMAEIERQGLEGKAMYSVVQGVEFNRYDLL